MMRAASAVLALALVAGTARAQESNRASEADTLRQSIFQARTAVALLRTGDYRLRAELTGELDAIQALATRPGLDPATVRDLTTRTDAVRRRARSGESVSGQGLGPMAVAVPAPSALAPFPGPAGTGAVVRLLQALDLTETAGGVIEAVIAEAVTQEGRVIAPVGTLILGRRTAAASSAGLHFDQIQIGFTTFAVDGRPEDPVPTRLRAGDRLRVRLSPPGR